MREWVFSGVAASKAFSLHFPEFRCIELPFVTCIY